MPNNQIHIVSFNIPFPANYGGVIDVYYKLEALHKAGVQIHLHCFEYGREHADKVLLKHCETVTYYQRNTKLTSHLSINPYIVQSRKSDNLLANLIKDNSPILFEGLHSCYYLNHRLLRNRTLLYRESNIEHHYYWNLFKSERHIGRKLFFLTESIKLLLFQRKLHKATKMLVVSETDQKYLQQQFPKKEIIYLPSFHGNSEVKSQTGKGDFVLYHGNLSVAENEIAAMYLLQEVFSKLTIPFIIAGLNPSKNLQKETEKYKHVHLVANPDKEKMESLISEAHLHILITFQPTGLKLKLLNTLFNGRFVLVNSNMLAGTPLESSCIVEDTPEGIRKQVIQLMNQDFTSKEAEKRKYFLENIFSDDRNAQELIKLANLAN